MVNGVICRVSLDSYCTKTRAGNQVLFLAIADSRLCFVRSLEQFGHQTNEQSFIISSTEIEH